jgi:5'-3' exoribonuclease 1
VNVDPLSCDAFSSTRNPWEGVNLLPFIDIALLRETIAKLCPPEKLSADERRRNQVGKVFCYQYDISCTNTVESPNKKIGLIDIVNSNSSVTVLHESRSQGTPFKPELIKGTQIPYPGFPSLNVFPIASVQLTPMGVNCFGSPSKYPNTLLSFHQIPEYPPLETMAESVLGRSVFVNWPMMHEGRVVEISDEFKSIRIGKDGKLKTVSFTDEASDRWLAQSEAMFQMYHTGNGVPGSGGVHIGEIKVRLKLLPLQGMRTNRANGSTKKLFGREEADVPLQLALLQAPAPDPRFVERGPLTLEDRFPAGSTVVLTKGKHRGCKGVVVGVVGNKNVGVSVSVLPTELPFGLAIARSVQESYLAGYDAARTLKMNPGLFGKITGKLQFEQQKYDLGLNLKSADGTCVVGYTRKKVDRRAQKGQNAWSAGDSLLVVGSDRAANEDSFQEKIQWEYTPRAVRLVRDYSQKFPQLFLFLKKNPNEKRYDANQVFGPNGEAWLPVIREWLNSHESAKLPRGPVTSESMSNEAVAACQKAADIRNLALKKKGYPKEALMKIPGTALYRECSTGATDVLLASDLNNNEGPELGDRIVNLCADGIPFGARGTVVAVHEASTTGSIEVVMDEEFIGGNSLQGACSNFRGRLCVWAHLLKVAPENSKGLVDKLVPKGAGQTAVLKIMSTIERDVKGHDGVSGAEEQKVSEASSGTGATELNEKPVARKGASRSPPRAASTDRSGSRARSTGRGGGQIQGKWREARGPDEGGGTGFKKGTRKGKNGLAQWKNVINPKPKSSPGPADQLKAMLGVSPNSQPSTATSTNELKALMGVSGAPTMMGASGPPAPADAAAGLKAMLGVNPNNGYAGPPASQPPPQPVSAADHLLHLMTSKQQRPPQGASPGFHPSPGQMSSFNFSYVEEGKEALPPQLVSLGRPGSGHMPMPMPPVPIQTYGPYAPTPTPFSSPFASPVVPGPQPRGDFPPLGGGGGVGIPAGPSEADFPPLGATPAKKIPPTPTKVEVPPPKPKAEPPSVMVPSAVAKARR